MLSAIAMGIATLFGAKTVAKYAGVATVGFGVATFLRKNAPRMVEVSRPLP